MASSSSSSSPSTSRSSLMSNIAGISLIVNKHGDQPARVLTFYKNNADVILIGRKSSTSSRPLTDEQDRALFRCPVISRRHAKITFTQYGNVYISDLASHHGTHIQRPGEAVPKPVPSDYPTVLADGDILTFGKPVGKESSLVHPVTARVHLLFTIPSTTSTPAQASTTPLTTPAAATTPSRTGSSGRYGMYTPAMTSSGSDSSSEDDIEEIPAPPLPPQLPPCSSFAGLPWGWPMSSFQHHPFQHPQLMQHPHHMHRADPVESHGEGSSAPGRLHLLRRILPRLGSVEEIDSHRGSTRMSPISISSDSRSSSEVVEVRREDAGHASTSTTPDVARVSRAASPFEDAGEDMELESEAPSEYPSYKEWSFDVALDAHKEAADNAVSLLIASSRICTPEPPSPPAEESDDSSDMYATPAPAAPPEETNMNVDVAPVMPFEWLDGDVLSVAPRAEVQFEAHVENLKSRLADFEQRLFAPESSSSSQDEPELAPSPVVEVESAQAVSYDEAPQSGPIDEPAQVVNMSNDKPVPAVEAREMVRSVKDMLQALDALRKKAETDMAQQMVRIRATRVEAQATLAAARDAAARAREAEAASKSLKRKREDEDEDDEASDVDDAPARCQAVYDRLATEPPRKRARTGIVKRIAVGVAKTTAIVTVGAVAAWTALAYS